MPFERINKNKQCRPIRMFQVHNVPKFRAVSVTLSDNFHQIHPKNLYFPEFFYLKQVETPSPTFKLHVTGLYLVFSSQLSCFKTPHNILLSCIKKDLYYPFFPRTSVSSSSKRPLNGLKNVVPIFANKESRYKDQNTLHCTMVVYSKIKDLQIYLGKCIELENNKIERK